ncbi:MAG TPA: monovalent cation/H+ antiporter complex subunit F [Vulgatibacter sp.]|nr:monovalent cation/H+ antiporter complex subunit F [Vulgatibacter sp.]
MSETFLDAAVLVLGILGFATLRTVAKRVDIITKVLAVDLLGVLLCGVAALLGYLTGSEHYLDIAIVLALLAFAGTVSPAQVISTGSLFGRQEER